jgi:hypothetical protein
MKRIEDMKLSEKNALYLEQRREIERLQNRVDELEEELKILKIELLDPVNEFIKGKCKIEEGLKIEAKILYINFETFLKSINYKRQIGSRIFYSELKNKGLSVKRGNQNKLYVHGLDIS